MSLTTDTDREALAEELRVFMTPGDPQRDEVRRDPYPLLDRLRAYDPVFRSPVGPFVVTSYDEGVEVLRHPEGKRERWGDIRPEDRSPAQRIFFENVGFKDPPEHTRLRRAIMPQFTAGKTNARRERVRQTVRDIVDELRDRESFDFFGELAARVPVTVIAEMIGLPPGTYGNFIEWSDMFLVLNEPVIDPTKMAAADAAAMECIEFFRELIESRRNDRRDDVISHLLDQADAGEKLTVEEVVSACMVLHIGGYETTANLITNGMYLLSQHPDQHQALRSDPSLTATAVEEMLRYEGSARRVARLMPNDTTIGGTPIAAGETVIVVLGAADRDPAHFPDPHRFDITREDNRHIAFGMGVHFCLGAALSRVEIQEAFNVLMTEYPELVVVEEPTWRDSFAIRGLEELEVAWS